MALLSISSWFENCARIAFSVILLKQIAKLLYNKLDAKKCCTESQIGEKLKRILV